MKKIVAQCFFCERGIARRGQDPVTLLAIGAKKIKWDNGANEEPSQTF